ncbi:helix-turn-helix transcriptional regulator [Halorubrum ezzemoulense]|uniref:helix-turn-helix transcriptional regulator n=1 Tax=Halorubrum ezzemoulense TaxID=337243 RepID=UPI0023307EB3|nr:helix-turn-helix transcriptional regulator [Halorubrum ezzemoulense]MDB2262383.1 helix-turn-helix transcriptional regulator [Halorubrum ezzemoulense]MDB2269122.1 helix-turn-helix transcriptional regulator [Halorubrum ezzemoulense]
MGPRQPAAHKRGVRLVSHATERSTAGITCSGVSPRLTEWIPELLADLQPHAEQTVREYATADPWHASSRLLDTILPAWKDTDTPWTDDVAEAVAYIRAITTLALTYRDEPTGTRTRYHRQRHADLTDTVTSVGTGRGPVNADLGALANGPVALHRELDAQPTTLTLLLDGDAWTSLTDRRTGVRALAAIAVLADGFDVRVVACPTVQRHLSKRYPDWTECHLDLTVSRDRSPHTDHATRTVESAWKAIRDLDTEPRKRRLLGNLDAEYAQSYRDLATDHAIDVAEGTVSRYVLDLEDRELVTVDRRGQHNTVQLTDLGKLAVQACLDDNDELVHPDQRRLKESLTATPQQSTSTVSPHRVGRETPTLDEWMAATGDPDEDADYVQWLTGPENTQTHLHERFSTVAHDDAITLADDQLHSFDDGRVAYLSHTNDETHVVLQWGGPLATLGRLAGALLSEKALSKILTPSRLGHEFEAIDDDTQAYPTDRILRRGHQVGWYSDAETTYGAWRDRITTARDRLLAKVADLTDSDDTAARANLFEDLHGLIASATQLYHAAGIDLTTTIRVPDTDALARNPTQLQDLCEFLAKTAPKQSAYGIHSGYRMLFEDRPGKLCRRLPAETDHDARMDLTMSWVVAGPTITELHDEITAALSRELTTVREAIDDGTETAPTLEIPVVDGTTYPAIRRVIDEVAMTHDAQWTPRERQRLVRLCLRSFGPAGTNQACPYDVVASLLRALNESPTPTLAAVERAAATLPPERFRPELTPTATKLYATLLRADSPLGRSELIEQAGISASSYDRRLSDVRDLDRVTPVQQGGHRRWTTTNLTPPPKTPPVTAWLPERSDRPASPLVTHRQLTTPAGPNSPPPDRTGGDEHGSWNRQPPISILTEPGGDAEYTTRPMTTTNQSRQPNSHAHQLTDTRDHPHDTMTPTSHPTTAVATPQTRLPNGGDQQ